MFRNASKLQRYKGLELKLIQNTRNPVSRQYAADPKCPPNPSNPPKKGNSSTGFGATVGALALLTGGVVLYAKYDEEFREWMDQQVPHFSNAIGFVFQEEKTYLDRLNSLPAYVKSLFSGEDDCDIEEKLARKSKIVKEEVVPYTVPRPAFTALNEEIPPGPCDPYCDKPYQEIRVVSLGDDIEILTPLPTEEKEKKSDVMEPQEAISLESQIGNTAKVAVECYQNAINVIRELSHNILEVINTDPSHLEPEVWTKIKEKAKEQADLLQTANDHSAKTKHLVDELNRLIAQNRIPGPDPVKAQAVKNAQRVLKDIQEAKAQVDRELYDSGLGRNAWDKVLAGREKWKEELLMMAPDADLDERNLKILEDELAEFVLYAYVNIQYYQKELALLDMKGEKTLKKALDAAQNGNIKPLIEEAVAVKVAEERRNIDLEFAKKSLELREQCVREIRLQLKTNSEIQLDHLNESLRMLEAEELRDHNRRLQEALADEQSAYRIHLAALVGRVRGIDEGLQEHAQVDKRAHQAQDLWAACQLFLRQVEAAPQLSPLENIVRTINVQAGDSDALVKAVIKTIPSEAISRGIYPTPILKERFLKVEKVARNLATVGGEGGSLASMFLSWIQANLMIENKSPLSLSEIKDEPTRVDLLNNYDLLSRARYWVLRGDLTQALKYMNLLQGSARCIAEDWMKEVRLNLECRQAALALVTHANALGMMYS